MNKRDISWNKLKKYSGLWVAIAGEEILTSGRTLEEVMKKVEASGKKAEVWIIVRKIRYIQQELEDTSVRI